jgi:hypothetical protein
MIYLQLFITPWGCIPWPPHFSICTWGYDPNGGVKNPGGIFQLLRYSSLLLSFRFLYIRLLNRTASWRKRRSLFSDWPSRHTDSLHQLPRGCAIDPLCSSLLPTNPSNFRTLFAYRIYWRIRQFFLIRHLVYKIRGGLRIFTLLDYWPIRYYY